MRHRKTSLQPDVAGGGPPREAVWSSWASWGGMCTLPLVLTLSLLWCAGLPWVAGAAPAPSAPVTPATRHCAQLFQRGDVEQATECWHAVARRAERTQQPTAQSRALAHLAQAYHALGHYRQALTSLETARTLAQPAAEPSQLAFILGSLGNVHLALGHVDTATQQFQAALDLAHTHGQTALAAAIQNDLGNLLLAQNRPTEAQEAFATGVRLATRAGNPTLVVRALTQAAMAAHQRGQHATAQTQLDEALAQARSLEPSHSTAYDLSNMGLTYDALRPHLPDAHKTLLRRAATAFTTALDMAHPLGDQRAASYAWGYLGRLYAVEQRYDEALTATRRAVLAAQRVHVPEALYQWQWQTGRLLTAQGDIEAAIAAYERAVATLQALRFELPQRYGMAPVSFRATFGPLYFELVDLLLQHAAALPAQDAHSTALLQQARATIEVFKAAELREYFQDECLADVEARRTPLEAISPQVVVVYPILLPDRLELLVHLPTGLTRFAIPVTAAHLRQVVRRFRWKLQHLDWRYLRDAQDLYDWLIRPFAPQLRAFAIETLVFVPDGVLRTIPMAALHDGKQFLIQQYALATTPGLDLTDPRPLPRRKLRVLVGGLTALPHVATEVHALDQLPRYQATVLLDQAFRLERLAQALQRQPFDIVHLASHGRFTREVTQSYIRTFDGTLTMAQLEQMVGVLRFREEPLELLMLSACETALGDDQAALGLAGVALKAGARSAVATLWSVRDRATSLLIAEFYRQLQRPSVSRAVALQRAQVHLLRDYPHPFFWAPFLLLNNWL